MGPNAHSLAAREPGLFLSDAKKGKKKELKGKKKKRL